VTLEDFLEQVGENFYADTPQPVFLYRTQLTVQHTHAIDLGHDTVSKKRSMIPNM